MNTVFPQVTIREKVEIKPTDNRKRINSGLSHSLRFEFSTSSGIALRMAITKPCQPFNDQADSMLYGMGSIVYSVDNASPGVYAAVLGVWLPGLANGETTENHYRVFLDGILVNDYVTISPSGNHNADIFDPFMISYTTPFYSGFNIAPFLDIMFTSQTNLLTYNLFNDSLCSPGGWNPEVDSMTYSIISGAEFGTLTFDDQSVGSTVTILLRDSSRLKFLANDTLPNGQDQNVTIQASSIGITSTSTFVIQEPPIFCTKVILNPSTIGVGDTATILLKKERPFRPPEDFPSETLFNVQIIDGQDFGTLLSSVSGDTMDSFTSIPAGFKFISTSNNGLDSVSIQIMASPSSSGNAISKRNDISKTISFIGACNPTGIAMIKKCNIQRNSAAINELQENMFNINRVDNNIGCNQHKNDINPPIGTTYLNTTVDYNISTPYYGNGTIYFSSITLTIEWGLCFQNLFLPLIPIYSILSSIDTKEKAELAILDLNRITPTGNRNVIYWPLQETEQHEKVHIHQHKTALKNFLDTAITKVNNLDPINNYCLLSAQALNDSIESRKALAKKEILGSIKHYVDWLKKQNAQNKPGVPGPLEAPAYMAGWSKTREIIERIKVLWNL